MRCAWWEEERRRLIYRKMRKKLSESYIKQQLHCEMDLLPQLRGEDGETGPEVAEQLGDGGLVVEQLLPGGHRELGSCRAATPSSSSSLAHHEGATREKMVDCRVHCLVVDSLYIVCGGVRVMNNS